MKGSFNHALLALVFVFLLPLSACSSESEQFREITPESLEGVHGEEILQMAKKVRKEAEEKLRTARTISNSGGDPASVQEVVSDIKKLEDSMEVLKEEFGERSLKMGRKAFRLLSVDVYPCRSQALPCAGGDYDVAELPNGEKKELGGFMNNSTTTKEFVTAFGATILGTGNNVPELIRSAEVSDPSEDVLVQLRGNFTLDDWTMPDVFQGF